MKRLVILLLIALLLVANSCELPAPLPPDKPAETQSPLLPLNGNPSLVLGNLVNGKCPRTHWIDSQRRENWVSRCWPDGYALYDLRENGEGNWQAEITTPLNVDYTGKAYSILPGGRAGQIGFTAPLLEFDAGCYVFKMSGQLHIWGKPRDYGANVIVGDNLLSGKVLPANGMYEFVWFWLASSETIADVTFYFSFAWGSATADSYVTIETLRVENVSLAHCE